MSKAIENRKTEQEALRALIRIIDLHVFEKSGRLDMNPLFSGDFWCAVEEAREAIEDAQ